MKNKIVIRQLTQSDMEAYRRIRLESLKMSPEAFGSIFSEEKNKPELYFEKQLRQNDEEHVIFGAFDEEEIIAVVCFKKESATKSRHKGEILQMYVDKDYRNKNIGKQILGAILSFTFEKFDELEFIKLAVVMDNGNAVYLYKNMGFEQYGLESNCFKMEDDYIDVMLMKLNREKFLK